MLKALCVNFGSMTYASITGLDVITCLSLCLSFAQQTVAHVLRPGGKIILSTIQESAPWLKELMDVHPTPFR